MSTKQTIILIDDFSSDSVTLYDNVTLYDFGTVNIIREWDYYLNNDFSVDGYGDVDYYESLTNYSTPRFFQVSYDNSTEWILGIDRDYAYNSGTGVGFGNYTSFYDDYYYFLAENTSNENLIHHGDWSLFALQSELKNQSDVEIILIDIDESD